MPTSQVRYRSTRLLEILNANTASEHLNEKQKNICTYVHMKCLNNIIHQYMYR